jgi:starch-binding outer membrane protein, SusD/RagB family
MTRNLKIFLLLFMISTGCSKNFIDKTPSTSVPLDQALNTYNGIEEALTGLYSNFVGSSSFGRNLPVIGDLQADNTYIGLPGSQWYMAQYAYNVISTDPVPLNIWSSLYTGILLANNIINAPLDTGSVAVLKSQAYALRALSYFKLITIFATPYGNDPNALGVPLVLTYNPYDLPKRNTIKEVYDQIVADLQTSLKNAPGYSNSIHISYYAMEAILAKVYLYEGLNAEAKSAAVDVINNSGFTLVTPDAYNAFWQNSDVHSDAVEVMFEIDESVTYNAGVDNLDNIYLNVVQNLFASSQLYDLYSATDIRKTLILPGSTNSGAFAYAVYKYPNALNPDPDNIKVIRLAEVYLIAAEASLPDNENDARFYLNALMAQRDPGFVYVSTGQALLNDIVQERRKELAFEGDRFYDMNRLNLNISRANNPGAIPAGQNNINLFIPYPDNRRVAPIPQQEIQANTNIATQQNPGY